MDEQDVNAEYLADVRDVFLLQRDLTERAIDQLDQADLFRVAGAQDNSIAVLLKHVGGNLRSRWTQPFDTDGEKPDRNRDGEFETGPETVADIRRVWDEGWQILDATLSALRPADLNRSLQIRGEPHRLIPALHRSLAHTAQHVGQIILLAKQWQGPEWKTLSIPRK
jgi:hypothetical protein